ncbi:uncharacterized protein FYW47_010585 [Aplochiton taeniatus]
MDGLETPYEVEGGVEFTDCTVIEKFYLFLPVFLGCVSLHSCQKEDALVARGEAFREHCVPDFKDIKDYLQYLRLNEPIIGLSHLEEVDRSDTSDPQPGPRYICKLCDLEANLPNMANHIVGRRHRQKYLEVKRKDLVTWDSSSMFNQFGKAIRAKAEVVERQEGQGSPKHLRKNRNVGKSNISNAQLTDLNEEYGQHGDHRLDDPYAPPYHDEDPYMSAEAENQAYMGEYHQRYDFVEEELRKADYMDDNPHRREFTEGYLQRENQDDYTEDTCRRETMEETDSYRPGYPEEMPHQQVYPEDVYPEKPTLHGRAYPVNDPLKQFYSEEVQRRVLSTRVAQERPFKGEESGGSSRVYDPPGPAYSEEDRQRHHFSQGTVVEQAHPDNNFNRGSMEFDYDHGKGYDEELAQKRAVPNDPYSAETRRAGYSGEDDRHMAQEPAFSGAPPYEPSYTKGSGDPEVKRTKFSEPIGKDGDYDKDHLFELLKTFRQEGRERRQHQGGPDPIRTAPSTYQRPPEGARAMANIPEPFKRFLEGATTDKNLENSKRKRKSRFSDASKDEMDMFQEMKFHPPPGRIDEYRPSRPEPYGKHQVQYQGESYQREKSQSRTDPSSGSGNVLDVLNTIEIENLEEANFLKDKLLTLLNEFQAKKSATGRGSQESDVISKDYNHKSKESLSESTPGRYERSVRGRSEERHNEQLRQPQELYYQDTTQVPHRGRPLEQDRARAWEEGKRLEKHRHTASREAPRSSRSQYEKVFGQVNPYPRQQEEPVPYSERSQGSRYHRDHPAAAEDHNPYSSSSQM